MERLMHLEIARLRVKPGMEKLFEEITKSHMAAFESFSGARNFSFYQCNEDKSEFYYLIEWDEIEDHTVRFRNSEFGQKAHSEIVPLLDGEPTVHHGALLMEARD
jgi:heme-degrading monooxygenase HmoA